MRSCCLASPSLRLTLLPLAALLAAGAAACEVTQDLGAGPPAGVADAGAPADAAAAPLGLRAFVTAATFDGNLVGAAGGGSALAAADTLCQRSAAGAALGGHWIAYLAKGADAAAARVTDPGPFYAVDGKTPLYTTPDAVGGGAAVEIPDERGGKPIDVSAGVDRFGYVWSSVGTASFWTGASAGGASSGADCEGWTTNHLLVDGSHASYLGSSDTLLSCESSRHLLCLEQKQAPAMRPDKRVFVTRETWKPAFGASPTAAIAAADARCAAAAADGGLEGTFRALLSAREGATTIRAFDRLTDARYLRTDGVEVFESKAQLPLGPSVAIAVDELGEEVVAAEYAQVWTGTLANGTPSPDATCAGWTSSEARTYGVVGALRTGTAWTRSDVVSCTQSNRLYCFEE